MAALTTLGIIHTAVSVVAVVSGIVVLIRDKQITSTTGLGKLYLITTFLTAATGLGIFQHGGFGPPHVLSILTILALVVGWVAGTTSLFGGWGRYVQAIAYTTTMFFPAIPGVTETTTRLPVGAPLIASADEPILQKIAAGFLVVLIVGLVFQLRWLRRGAAR
jgi:uncharacterized membrane protein